MDMTSEKPEGDSSAPVVRTPPEAMPLVPIEQKPVTAVDNSKKVRSLQRRFIGVLIIFLAIAYAVYANFSKLPSQRGSTSIVPTQAVVVTNVPMEKPKPSAIATSLLGGKNSWMIKLDTYYYSLQSLPTTGEQGRKDVTATLYTPLQAGEQVCFHFEGENVFLKKKVGAGFTRLCDQNQPTAAPHVVYCQAYDPEKGFPISATFYPVGTCNAGSKISTGEYVIHAQAYTGCTVDAKGLGQSCRGIVDVDSPSITVNN